MSDWRPKQRDRCWYCGLGYRGKTTHREPIELALEDSDGGVESYTVTMHSFCAQRWRECIPEAREVDWAKVRGWPPPDEELYPNG